MLLDSRNLMAGPANFLLSFFAALHSNSKYTYQRLHSESYTSILVDYNKIPEQISVTWGWDWSCQVSACADIGESTVSNHRWTDSRTVSITTFSHHYMHFLFSWTIITQWNMNEWNWSQRKHKSTRMWANAQPDGRPAEHRWRPVFNAPKFGWRPLLDGVQ